MRKNNKTKSLSLSTQTIRSIAGAQLDAVAGGALPDTFKHCYSTPMWTCPLPTHKV